MSLAAAVLPEEGLRAVEDGVEVDIHLNWYRSLPVSCVATVELELDGAAVPPERIAFRVNGRECALEELAERDEEEWYVLDPATLVVRGHPVRPGDAIEVRLRLGNRIPYLLIGPDRALEIVSERAERLVAR